MYATGYKSCCLLLIMPDDAWWCGYYPKSRRTPPEIHAINPGSLLMTVSISKWQEGQTILVVSGPTGTTAVTITGWPVAARRQMKIKKIVKQENNATIMLYSVY